MTTTLREAIDALAAAPPAPATPTPELTALVEALAVSARELVEALDVLRAHAGGPRPFSGRL